MKLSASSAMAAHTPTRPQLAAMATPAAALTSPAAIRVRLRPIRSASMPLGTSNSKRTHTAPAIRNPRTASCACNRNNCFFKFIGAAPFLIRNFWEGTVRPDRKGPRQCSRGPSKCANESRFYLQMGALIHGTAKTAPLDKQMLATLQNITVHPLFRIAAWLYAIN